MSVGGKSNTRPSKGERRSNIVENFAKRSTCVGRLKIIRKTIGEIPMRIAAVCGFIAYTSVLASITIMIIFCVSAVRFNATNGLLDIILYPLWEQYKPLIISIIGPNFSIIRYAMILIIAVVIFFLIGIMTTVSLSKLSGYLAKHEYLPHRFNSLGNIRAFFSLLPFFYIFAGFLILISKMSLPFLITVWFLAITINFGLTIFSLVLLYFNRGNNSKKEFEHNTYFLKAFALIIALGVLIFADIFIIIFTPVYNSIIYLVIFAFVLLLFIAVHRYYSSVRKKLSVDLDKDNTSKASPSRVHAIVLVTKFNKPTLRAISYAKAARPSTIELLHVTSSDGHAVTAEWEKAKLSVALRILSATQTDLIREVARYVRSIHHNSDRELVIIYLPQYQSVHPFEKYMHNQSAARLQHELMKIPSVVVALVPWQG